LPERANWFEKATGYDQQKLKPRYPTSGSRAARAELPAAIDGYSVAHRFLRRGPVEYKPGTLRKDGSYNWSLLSELLARLLRYPDDQYWITVQRCLPFFTYARTRKARLMTNFADEIRDLSLEQLQSLYREAFNLNPACSLELSRQLHLE